MRWFALRTRLGRIGQIGTRRARSKSGRILAVKWGLNPNSSSLGVDVTFLLFGAAALSMATPVIGALLRWRKPAMAAPDAITSEAPSGHASPTSADSAR
jgi:hypothetical protein